MALTATLVPTADDASTGSPSVTGAATKWQALLSDDDDTSYVQFGGAGTVSCAFGDIPAAIGIDGITVSTKYKFLGAATDQQTRLYVIISGTSYYGAYSASVSGTYATLSKTWTLNPATSTPWTKAALDAAKFGIQYDTLTGESIRYSYLASVATYTPAPASITVARDVGSRMLWMKRGPEVRATLSGNLDLMVPGFLGALDVEHEAAPHATDAGWQAESWQRRPMVIYETTIDPNAMTVEVQARDMRPLLCLVRDLAWSDKASGALGDGIARFATPGATWTFTRASSATFTNPVGESETVAADVPCYADGGLEIKSAAGGRADEFYAVSNDSGSRTWPATMGGFGCEVNFATLTGDFQNIVTAYHDANNSAAVAYDGNTGAWIFQIIMGGVTKIASYTATPSTGVWYQVGARWIGSAGEHGLAPYTMGLWIDRVERDTEVAAGVMTEVSSPTYGTEFGTFAGVAQLDGQIRKIHIFQYPPSDIEMSRPL